MEFGILGPLEVRDGDQLAPVRGAKQRAFLALLLIRANEVVSTDRLIEEIWGESAPEQAAHVLQVNVSQLRKMLSHERLVTRMPGYMLRVDPGQLDAQRFERLLEDASEALTIGDVSRAAIILRNALGLWRGPALADFSYEAFAQAEISRLEELRLVALSWRIEADLALGRHAELVGELQGLIAQHPLRERLRAQLMLALYRSGRQAEALKAYRDARAALVEGLGIDPGEALQELERQILRHDPSLDLGAQASPAAQIHTSPDRSLLVVAGDGDRLDALLGVAEPLSRSPRREIIVARIVAQAGELASAGAEHEQRRRTLAQRGVAARSAAFTSPSVGRDLARLAREEEVDLLLLAAPDEFLETGLFDSETSTVLVEAQCDVGLLASAGKSSRTIDRPVLVPFAGDEHDWAAAELGASIAAAEGCALRLAGVDVGSEHGRDASRLLATASLLVQKVAGIAAEPLLVHPGADAMIEAARGARLILIGLPTDWRFEGVREARLSIARVAPTLLVRRGIRPGGLVPRETLTRFSWTLAGAGGATPAR